MVRILSILILYLAGGFAYPQAGSKQQPDSRMNWWREARFGMFIHWGLYALPAGEWGGKTGYGEWIRTSAEIPLKTYDKFVSQFDPVNFNADDWVRMARDAGMKYIVITSKHHDGFCMFDTKQTDFCIMSTPFQRDPMKELSETCTKYGITLCFYYSIMDWHHPDYLPRRDWEKNRPVKGADFERYVSYMKEELRELLTNYGRIGVLWFDGEWESTWNETYGKEIYQYCRSLQPDLIINNRVGAGRMDMEGLTKEGAFGGDFGTPEQQIPATGLPGTDWETCMTMNDHWGYNRNDKNFKSSAEIIRMLCDIASKGGNYLLNVGPTALGEFPQESIDRLHDIGEWMKVNGESVYGTTASPFKSLSWGRCTKKNTPSGTRMYLHVFDWPQDRMIRLEGCLNEPVKAWVLADPKKSVLKTERNDDAIIILLPDRAPDPVNSVIVLDLKGRLDLTNPPEILSEFNRFIDTLKVMLQSERDNVEIRYTLNGKEPDSKSPRYTSPLYLTESSTLKTRCFRKGKPVSGVAEARFEQVPPLPSRDFTSTGIKPVRGLGFRYYEGEFDSLPDFSKLKPKKEGTVNDFTLEPRKRDEKFAFLFSGYLFIPETGMYTFYTDSDDGSHLVIDGNIVVNNDGLHPRKEQKGYIPLSQGFHLFQVGFFERTGQEGLLVSYKFRSDHKKILPAEWLYH